MSKRNENIITHCEIDNTNFISMRKFLYHLKKLNITEKEYYDKYLKTENEGICSECKKESKFINIGNGYSKFCCYYCSSINEDVKKLKYENATC